MNTNVSIYDHLNSLDQQKQKIAIEQSLYLKKAFQSDDVDTIFKAQQFLAKLNNPQGNVKPVADTSKSLLIDPYEVSSSMGYYQKRQAMVSFDILRAMGNTPIIAAIINTRKDQVAGYCTPQPDKYSKGFIFRKIGSKANDEKSDREKKEIDQLTAFILDCAESEDKYDLHDFDQFIRMLVEDALILDQSCFEVVRNKAGQPSQFLAVDGGSIALADTYDNESNINKFDVPIQGQYPKYVQLYQNRIVNEYYPWELCFGIRNASTNIYRNGYGKSELEILISNVTSMLNADSYNSKFFKNGTAPKGALLVKTQGGLNPDKIAELRRSWGATMSGVENMHKTPILNADHVEWLDLQKTNRDMEFSSYQEYLIKVACAVYKISPEEIGFPLQGSKGNGLGSKEGGKEEKEYSQDKGLKPLLKSIQTWINKYIVGPKSDWKYEFLFVGLDTEDSKTEEERLQKAVTLYMTINEARETRGLDPLPNGAGDIIMNTVFTSKMQADQQSQLGINPFTNNDSQQQEEENPMQKALNEWWVKEMVA